MRKKKITRLVILCFLLAAMCLFTSCKKKESKESGEKPGTVHVLDDFEKSADLYAFKPSVTNTVASMSITNKTEGQVKEGEGSLKYEFEGGVSPDMLLFVEECSFPELDIANLNKIDVSVYSEKEVEATLSVITTKKAKLMSETYTLKANEWTDLSFRLSALACEYNADKIVGFGLRLDSSEPLTFYVDNWTATMGAENTAEDDKWEPILKKIIKRINNLPKKIKLADGEELEDLYSDYAELPELYRNIIPNYDKLREAIVAYTEVRFASEEDALERKMLAFDEFYGIGQIDGEYPILYQKDVKCEDEKGSIMITFDGSTQESYFAYTTPLDPKRYDYVEMSFYNDDTNRKVIYFNWNQSVVVQPGTWATMKIPGEEFHAKGNIIVDTINQDGIRINSSGRVYMGTLHAYRRDLLTELKKLPNAADFEMPRDIKYLTLVEKTMELYEKLPDTEKAGIPEELIANLKACYEKIEGYSTIFDVNTEDIQFGTPDCKAQGKAEADWDEEYGPVYRLNFTAKADGDYAAGFQFNKDMSEVENLFFYIYNPKLSAQTMYLYADGSWKDLGARTLEPGWNKIEVPKDVKITTFMFGLFPKTADVVGEWKVTSLYSVSNELVDRSDSAEVSALIQALPDAGSLQMPRDLKYIAAISEAEDAYNALSSNAKGKISSALKAKLDACLAATKGYRAAINARSDEMMAGTYDCACVGTVTRLADDNYGTVFGLEIMAPDTGGDYAAGFQINKDISGSKNLFFYVYNPKKSAQTMYLYADSEWKDLGARTLNPGWNKIELSNNIKIQKYVFGLFPKGTDVTGQWKISSFYALSDTVVDKQQASETSELLKKLPAAFLIQMPRDLKYVAEIQAAKDAYNALSSNAKTYVNSALVKRLNTCLEAIDGYGAVVNAITDEMMVGTYDCFCAGVLERLADENYGTVFGLKITTADKSGDYAAGFQVNKNLSASRNLFFYVYNPKKSAQSMYLYADSTWKDLGARTLNPGWNKIEIANDKKIQQYVFGLFPKGADVTGTWKVSSFYTVSDAILDKEAAASTIEAIKALPDAGSIILPEELKVAADIYAAKESYEALSSNAKKYVSAALKSKLQSCLDAMDGYEVVVNAKTDDMMVGTPDCLCKGVMKCARDEEKGAVFALNITEAAGGDYAAGFQVGKNLSEKKNVFFSIYNPQDTEQIMYLYADSNWKDLGARTLEPGWNKIELPNDKRVSSYIFGLFPQGQNVVGEWLITSFYAVSDEALNKELASEAEEKILALPEADALTEADREVVMNAKAAYDALTEEQKVLVSTAAEEKLEACIAKMEELGLEAEIAYDDTSRHAFDYYSDADNAAYANAVLEDVEVDGKTAKWSATVHVTRQNGGYARAYQGLRLTKAQLEKYKEKGYTHLRIPYYLTAPEGSSNVAINIHSDGWEWNYKKGADAVLGRWSYFDYPIDDLLLKPGNKTVLEGINTANGAYGLVNININATGAYTLYLGQCKMVIPEQEPDESVIAAVRQTLQNLPEATNLSTGDIAAVKDLQAEYDALREIDKAQLTETEKEKIEECIAALPSLYVNAVMEKIAALPEAGSLVVEDKGAVMEAKAAYDALTPGQQAQVANADKLEACLAKIEALEQQGEQTTKVAYLTTLNHRFDYYCDANNAAYAEATLGDVEIAGKTAKWSATVNVTRQNGGYARAYQALDLTLEALRAYKEAGYTHLRIPYYLTAPEGSSNVAIYVHSDGWEWNYKKGADAVLGEWSSFDYPIDDLLLKPGSKTVLEGINTANGAYGLINININATGEYRLYLGQCELVKPVEGEEPEIVYSASSAHRFDYYSDPTNAAYAGATLADVEVAGKTARWSATIHVTQQNGGYARAYQGLELTLAQLQEYKEAGYTHLRIPYYLTAPEGSSNVAINIHSDGWEWNYKKGADAVLGEWSSYDYPIDDLLLKPGSKTVLEGINTANGAYGLINININATGEYKLYLGTCTMVKK